MTAPGDPVASLSNALDRYAAMQTAAQAEMARIAETGPVDNATPDATRGAQSNGPIPPG